MEMEPPIVSASEARGKKVISLLLVSTPLACLHPILGGFLAMSMILSFLHLVVIGVGEATNSLKIQQYDDRMQQSWAYRAMTCYTSGK